MPPRPSPGDQRLSMIAEDADHQPSPSQFSGSTIPARRPNGSSWRDTPPRASSETESPAYTLWDVTGPKGEKLADVRNNKYLARRGGWKRLCLILLLVLLIIIVLAVGLGVGLSRRNSNSSPSTSPSQENGSATAGPFPQGSYQFPADLVSVSTNCTANSATWQCWPYHLYSSGGGLSEVIFSWIISNSTGSQSSPSPLLISSSDDPFALTFSNASLTLLDGGTPNERYAFSIQLDKYVQPPAPLTSSDVLDGCWFNGTTLAGALYTKKQPDPSAAQGNATDDQAMGWPTWTSAMEVNQTINGGNGVPSCYQLESDGSQGPQVTNGLEPLGSNEVCGCYWRNFNLA